MESMTYLFVVILLLAGTLASLAIWAPRRTWVRVLSLTLAVLIIPVAYIQMTELLSRAKPAKYEWWRRQTDTVTILDVSFHEGVAIYLWLRLDGDIVPRYYSLPWSTSLAEKIEDALEDAVLQNGNVVLRHLFSRQSLDEHGDLNVEIIPPPVPHQKPPYVRPDPVPDPRNPKSKPI